MFHPPEAECAKMRKRSAQEQYLIPSLRRQTVSRQQIIINTFSHNSINTMPQEPFAIMSLLGMARDKLTRKSHARKASRAEQGLTGSAPTTEIPTLRENNRKSGSGRHIECLAYTQGAGHTTMPSPTSHSSASKPPKIVMSGSPASAGYFHSSHITEDRGAWPYPATRSYDDRTAA
ncbi:hypothetical protein AC578_9560 [Pseudocercospora eumusae]|uniref:Uncharacterized protein n=1 Tax=Pseudocercospora eumusae TaxID=321146 RepID=A0A139HG77_9PEZI|nr:hypothetical protein AC578_9560 [Pseudocercospora eumusae]